METTSVVTALGALAHETRLQAFRLLIEVGPEGLPATEIANRLGVQKSLMSTHLNTLSRAGLTSVVRNGRQIIHTIDLSQTRDLLSFLVKDCCNGDTERCASLLDQILPIYDCESDCSIVQ
ncbi:ArsR/SmtB family transcription factor [Congregibacter litoralis]|uniref:Transcriptional regulator, ArsR family n=1 Tax=Congregibacter litoralis KT71 TaxID=314285 RepID=V7HV31_9GAMM|nr:transcriptional regulator, ArsR family [Congregibacter litoralis KT71]